MVWDIYTGEIMNDRIVVQQMMEKLFVEKLYNRPYQMMEHKFFCAKWGRNNIKGHWKNSRFNAYQL